MHVALRALFAASVAALALTGLALAGTTTPPGGVEATFSDARAKDDVVGVLTQADTEIRFEVSVPAGSTLSADLAPEATASGAASGVALRLCDPTGGDIDVVGTGFDKTKAGKDSVKWRQVPLDAFGVHVLAVSAATPGGFRLRLSVAAPKTKAAPSSSADLAVDGTETVTFKGRVGDVAKVDVRAGKKSKFRGEILRVRRPGGSEIVPETEASKLKLTLDEEGEYTLEFQNVGKAAGAWQARTRVAPRKAKKRRGLVSAAQTGLVPVVKTVDPDKGVHLDTALAMTIRGRDFQPGADVRLEQNGRDDIVATDVDVVSDSEITCVVDLDTRGRDGGTNSVGKWHVAVRNAPLFADIADPSSIDRDAPLVNRAKTFTSVSSGSVKLPRGVEDGAEVWHVSFTDDFADDLLHMGLSSTTPATRNAARDAVEDYVIAYLRDLFLVQETNGNTQGLAVPVSFVQGDVTRVAGEAGEDYNQVLVGGAMAQGAPSDPAEPLPWGYAALDDGNLRRDIVTVATDVLDPRGGNPYASSSFRQAMQPLRDIGLGQIDSIFFEGRFDPGSAVQVERFAAIVTQLERVAREVAALIAHQVGKAMGLPTAGEGPMAAPSTAGALWVDRDSLAFSGPQLATLRANAVNSDLPGKSDPLKIVFFPIVDRRPLLLPDLTTGTPYSVSWDLVGGRCNAVPADYRLSFQRGSNSLPGLTLSYDALAGTAPVCLDGGCANIDAVYCGVAQFTIRIEDTLRSSGSLLAHRLRIVPDINQFPPGHPLRNGVQSCINTVLNSQ